MALTAGSIVTRVARALRDQSHETWPVDELLEHISDAQRAIVLLVPEANPKEAVVNLDKGVRQKIPSDGYQLLTVTRNMAGAQLTSESGMAVSPTGRSSLDDAQREWTEEGEERVVTNFLYDVRTRKHFYVYPPNDGTGFLEVFYAKIPTEVSAESDPLELDDIYVPPIRAYVMAEAYLKDTPAQGQEVGRSTAYFEKFMTLLLGREDENETKVTVRNEITERNRASRPRP